MLLVRALLGRVRDFGQDSRRAMDLRPGEHAVTDCGFDAGRAGPHRSLCMGPGDGDSYVYVVYSEVQVYPELLIR